MTRELLLVVAFFVLLLAAVLAAGGFELVHEIQRGFDSAFSGFAS